MSYYDRYKVDALYISSCGTLTNDLKANLPFDLKKIGIKKVIVAFDNDEAGKRMTRDMRGLLEGAGLSVSVRKPKLKDWNDDLKNNVINKST